MTAPNQREHILDEALSLMSEHGSAAMSMRRLAAACGLQVAAIYHYFPSKDALLAAVFAERRYSSRLEEPIELDASGSTEDRLRAVFEVFWTGALQEEPVLRLLLGEGLRSHPVALPTGTALLEVFRSGVRLLLESHVPELASPGFEALDDVVELCIGGVFSAFVEHVFAPDLDPNELGSRQAERLCRVVLGTGGPGSELCPTSAGSANLGPSTQLVGDSA